MASDTEFTGTPDERRRQAEVLIMRIVRDLYGNGTPGLVTRIESFITRHDTEQDQREKQHVANRNRLNLIIAILAVLGSYLAFFKGHF